MKEGVVMNAWKFLKNNHGLTLIEVLVSLTILGIVVTSFLSFFNQAYSYTKKNEDKTVGINVARNVLYYFEQQEYEEVEKEFFVDTNGIKTNDSVDLTIDDCSNSGLFDESACKGIFSTKINNVDFTSKVVLSKRRGTELENYLTDVVVTVTWNEQTATVKGLIKK